MIVYFRLPMKSSLIASNSLLGEGAQSANSLKIGLTNLVEFARTKSLTPNLGRPLREKGEGSGAKEEEG